jgi:Spy/CpxP family protein refolding chaperone
MKKILAIFLVLTFVMTVFTGGVFAHGSQSRIGAADNQSRYQMGDRSPGIGYNSIELSEEQINEIADLRDEFYNETEELRDQLRDLNRELRDLEFRGAGKAEIREVEDKMEQVLIQMDEKRIENQGKIESILTEEQLNIIEENRGNYEERYQSRFNNYFGYGMGMMGGGFSGSRNYNDRDLGFGYGMMGRNYNDRDLGYGFGFCH